MVRQRIRSRLLRRHVCRSSQRHALRGEVVPPCGLAHRLRHPEVRHQRMTARQHDVLGLQVPVHHPVRVGLGEGVRHVPQDPHYLAHRKLPLPHQPVPKRGPFDVGHHVVEEAVGFAGVVEGKDVGMLEARGEVDLGQEPLGSHGGGQLRAQDLDCDVAIVLQVVGQPDGGHAALAQLPLQDIAIREGSLQAIRGAAHGRAPEQTPRRPRGAVCRASLRLGCAGPEGQGWRGRAGTHHEPP